MPQASEELRAEWGMHPEYGIDVCVAETYLIESGFKLTRGWEWIPPKAIDAITEQEWSAMSFLVQEWDYGGIYYPS